jgi:arsenate reductase (thioredoxin)
MDTRSPSSTLHRIAFVCLHGSAKSVIAAEYLNRLAAQRGLNVQATAAGCEPDPSIPPHVIDGLGRKGFDVSGRTPVAVSAPTLATADRVIAFGCDIASSAAQGRPLEQWSDCPAVSEDFELAWSYITARIDRMLAAERE